jgi:hypothetical protein
MNYIDGTIFLNAYNVIYREVEHIFFAQWLVYFVLIFSTFWLNIGLMIYV